MPRERLPSIKKKIKEDKELHERLNSFTYKIMQIGLQITQFTKTLALSLCLCLSLYSFPKKKSWVFKCPYQLSQNEKKKKQNKI